MLVIDPGHSPCGKSVVMRQAGKLNIFRFQPKIPNRMGVVEVRTEVIRSVKHSDRHRVRQADG